MRNKSDSILFIAAILFVTWVGRNFMLHNFRDLAGSETSSRVSLTSDVTCGLGEIDALDMDLFYGGSSIPLLLTVESETGTMLGSKPVRREELSRPIVLELSAPIASTASVYFCTDRAKAGSCHGKPQPRLTEIVVENTRAAAKDPNFHNPPDRIFYGQPIFADHEQTIRAVLFRHGGSCR